MKQFTVSHRFAFACFIRVVQPNLNLHFSLFSIGACIFVICQIKFWQFCLRNEFPPNSTTISEFVAFHPTSLNVIFQVMNETRKHFQVWAEPKLRKFSVFKLELFSTSASHNPPTTYEKKIFNETSGIEWTSTNRIFHDLRFEPQTFLNVFSSHSLVVRLYKYIFRSTEYKDSRNSSP